MSLFRDNNLFLEVNQLTNRVDDLEELIRNYRSEMENPVKDQVMITVTRRKLFAAVD
jgi:hypothetical protein